ncbi:unnamed protein product [Pelagomonas calceolata]|uniref:Uncharacterized protein n=1 Tax=Pelagomonas calceolata TaxID=35677 RepID=A0A8J2SI66_9STRA|nr:unnamed protein product [Pelagomonas calceolata]
MPLVAAEPREQPAVRHVSLHLRVFYVLELVHRAVHGVVELVQQRGLGAARVVDRLRLGDAVHAQRRRERDRELVALLALKEFGVHVDQELDLVDDALAHETIHLLELGALRVDLRDLEIVLEDDAGHRLRVAALAAPRHAAAATAAKCLSLCRCCCGSGVP